MFCFIILWTTGESLTVLGWVLSLIRFIAKNFRHTMNLVHNKLNLEKDKDKHFKSRTTKNDDMKENMYKMITWKGCTVLLRNVQSIHQKMCKAHSMTIFEMCKEWRDDFTNHELVDNPTSELGTRLKAATQKTRPARPDLTPHCRSTPRSPCPSRAGSSSKTKARNLW